LSDQLQVWQWSAAIQWTSLVLIALFFAALGRSFRGQELRAWVAAWACNAVALSVTAVFWWTDAHPAPLRHLLAGTYIVSKSAFGVLALRAAQLHQRPSSTRLLGWPALAALGAYALSAPLLQPIELLGLVQQSVLAALLAAAVVSLWRGPRGDGRSFLAAGLLVRSALAGAEAVVYAAALSPEGWVSPELRARAAAFLAAHSFLDTVAEWLLALTVVLALSERVHGELRHTNRGLLAAQADLRRLADRDPLTGLDNRRGLAEILRAAQPRGALLLFFDLDGFKEINDRHGHRAGDACLQRFAEALRASFRPDDRIVRFGGDEFLVVAPGLDGASAGERLKQLEQRLRREPATSARLAFSVGTGVLPPGGSPEAALEDADRAMYAGRALRRA